MTQKAALFKGLKKKEKAANSHGKGLKVRKGKLQKAPNKKTSEYLSSKEATKFINAANESKAAALAGKDGARLTLIKGAEAAERSSAGGKKQKGGFVKTK